MGNDYSQRLAFNYHSFRIAEAGALGIMLCDFGGGERGREDPLYDIQ